MDKWSSAYNENIIHVFSMAINNTTGILDKQCNSYAVFLTRLGNSWVGGLPVHDDVVRYLANMAAASLSHPGQPVQLR